ncbi:MAG: protein-L-isoaspartate(D-aspartate) O-methyltransferase [Puniceicoccaceae bacterium]
MKWPFQSSGNGETDLELRQRMVEHQIRRRGIRDKHVLAAMARVPRHAFVPASMHELSYTDGPLPIGKGQTISQPYIVASMSEALHLQPGMKVLEVGTGSGYQAAVLAEMGLEVYTIEYIHDLAMAAKELLRGLGYPAIHFRCGDGRLGWPEKAPFDGIIVTAAADEVPTQLGQQLAAGGRLVIPVGTYSQDLWVYQKNDDGTLEGKNLYAVRFVPLVRG